MAGQRAPYGERRRAVAREADEVVAAQVEGGLDRAAASRPAGDPRRRRRPSTVLLRPASGLDVPLPLALVTRRDSTNRALRALIRAVAAAQAVHLTSR